MRVHARTPTRAALIDLADLWLAGVLDDQSMVWLGGGDLPVMWAITGRRSRLIVVHRCAVGGYVRLTRRRVRWDRTSDGTRTAALDLHLDSLPSTDTDSAVEVVIAHSGSERVGVIADSLRAELGADGSYTAGRVTITDLAAARAASIGEFEPAPAPSPISVATAHLHGVRLLAAGLPEPAAIRVRERAEALGVEISPEALARTCEYLDAMDTYRAGWAQVAALGLE